jgi:hypothetical protein
MQTPEGINKAGIYWNKLEFDIVVCAGTPLAMAGFASRVGVTEVPVVTG